MNRMRAAVLIGALGAAVVLLVASSWAEEESVHLRYQASAQCPPRAAFVAEVGWRTERARWVDQPDGVRQFEIQLRQGGSGVVGTLAIRAVDGGFATRQVEGQTCEEVTTALALITALAIDPQAKVELPPPPSDGGSDADAGSIMQAEAGIADADGAAEDASPENIDASPENIDASPEDAGSAPLKDADPVDAGTPEDEEGWVWTVGAHARATSGLGDALSFVLPAFVDVAHHDGVLAPSFRLEISYLFGREFDHALGTAEIMRWAGHLTGCPIWVELGIEEIGLRPCLGLEMGALYGIGNVPPKRRQTALWLAFVTGARLQFMPWEWALVEIQGEFGVPILRQRFFFEPDNTIVQVDSVFGTVGGGIGVRFP